MSDEIKIKPIFEKSEQTYALAAAILDSGNVVVMGDGCSSRGRDIWILQHIIQNHIKHLSDKPTP